MLIEIRCQRGPDGLEQDRHAPVIPLPGGVFIRRVGATSDPFPGDIEKRLVFEPPGAPI